MLPFVNMSAERENEYFSDGMTEELINALSKVEGLRVAARTSAFAFKGKDADVREVGEKLRVATVLAGSVRSSGTRLRVTAQLMDAEQGVQLWSETYDRELADVFAVQDELSRAIVSALKVTLAGDQDVPLVSRPTQSLEAYNLYLQGRYSWNQRTEAGLKQAVRYFEQAITMDSGYAQAYAGLADAYVLLPERGPTRPAEVYPKAEAAALRALALDSTLAEAHTSLGYVLEVKELGVAARRAGVPARDRAQSELCHRTSLVRRMLELDGTSRRRPGRARAGLKPGPAVVSDSRPDGLAALPDASL